MKVLLSSFVHWWNAEAAYAAVLGEELLAAGHDVWILTQPGTRNESELIQRGLPIITDIPPADSNPFHWKEILVRLRKLQEQKQIQIVDVFRSAELPFHLAAARATARATTTAGSGQGIKVVRTRGTARPVKGHWLNRKMHRDWCDGLIASSGIVREEMASSLNLPAEDIKTIYFPIDARPLLTKEEKKKGKKQFLEELGIGEERFLIGIVGRLYPEKGHDQLLTALEILTQKHPEVLLIILAKDAKGEDPERPSLEARAAQPALKRHIRFLSFREDVRSLMGWMDVGVIPSVASEVNCRVAVEFFSTATPVVAFPTGALPEVVEQGISGLITPSHSPEDLATALATLAEDEQLREKLGQGAHHSAQTRFSRSKFLQETLTAFQKALDG